MATLVQPERLGDGVRLPPGLKLEGYVPIGEQPQAAATNPPASIAISPRAPEAVFLILGLVLFVLAGAAAWLLSQFVTDWKVTFAPPDGVSMFAVFFLAATLIERVLEPFSSLLVRATPQKSAGGPGTEADADDEGAKSPWYGKSKTQALNARAEKLLAAARQPTPGSSESPESLTKKAAAEEATAKQAMTNGGFFVWSVATLVAVALCFYLGLSLPAAIGIHGGTIGWIDLFMTATIIGAGTKPLHDLISTMQNSKEKSETA